MITGPNGFLYNQLTMEDSDDLLFLLGAPTTDNKVMLDEYVQTTKDIIRSNRHKYTVFASTAWIEQSDDYYNKSKKELELFIEENCSKYLILKIADIIKDNDILQLARHHAKSILKIDPSLTLSENQVFLHTYKQLGKYKNIWNYIS